MVKHATTAPDILVRSKQDDHDLVLAVDERFRDLCHMHRRVRGVELPIPKSMKADFERYGRMLVRHAHDDYRHTAAELKSVKIIAQWTFDVKCDICGKPTQTIEFR